MRKRTTIYIRRDLVEEAKRRGINISRFIEKKLEEELLGKKPIKLIEKEEQRRSTRKDWCGGRDSNPRRPTPSDLKSDAFGQTRPPPLI